MRAAASSCNQALPERLVLRAASPAALASSGGNASLLPGEALTDICLFDSYGDGMSTVLRAYLSRPPLTAVQRGLQAFARSGICRTCHVWCEEVICGSCLRGYQKTQTRCRRCALPCVDDTCEICRSSPPPWTNAAAAVSYAAPWREMIIDYKFREYPGLHRFFAELLKADPAVQAMLAVAGFVLPVPLAAVRLRQRGFNQSALLARHLAPQRMNDQILWRLRQTATHAGLDRTQRQRNLRHSMAVNPAMSRALRGSRVLLVDDVMTTGSTLTVCAQTLLDAGVAEVSCVVFARAAADSGSQ